jgi:biotin carboxyl carrier protein
LYHFPHSLILPTLAQIDPKAVIVLEAMKMENDLPSPIAGTIKEVRTSKGQTVNQGDVLVVIHAD